MCKGRTKSQGTPDRPLAPYRGSGALPANLPRPSDLGSHSRARQTTPPSERKGCARAAKKDRETTGRPLAPCRGSGALLANLPGTQRPALALRGPANAINSSLNRNKAPGGVNPLLQGLGGYTRRVRSRAPTGTTRTKHNPDESSCKPSLDKPSGRVLALPPRPGGYCRIP